MAAETLPPPVSRVAPDGLGAADRQRIAWGLAAVWLVAGAVMLVLRPEALLEHAAVGAAGLLAVVALDWRDARRVDVLLAAAVALGVAATTWPLRRYVHVAEQAPVLLTAVLLPPSLAILAALALRPSARERTPGRLLGAAAGCALLGAAIAALLSVRPSAALFAAWTGYAVPVALGLLVAVYVRSARDAWRLATCAVLAALPVLVVVLAAWLTTFGVPRGAGDVTAAKAELSRPTIVQELSFGNVGNTATLLVALLPLALACATAAPLPRAVRAGAGAVVVLATIDLVLLASRASLVAAALAAGALAVVAASRLPGRPLAAAGCATAIVLALAAAAVVLDDDRDASGARPPGFAATAIAPVAVAERVLADTSVETRREAIRQGLDVARDHLPFGVGPGLYSRYAPVTTAPHSLAVLAAAELGVLGVAALVLIAGAAAVPLLARRRGDLPADAEALVGAAAVGVLGWLLLGVVAGTNLSVGTYSAWALVIWLQLGLLRAVRS